MRKFLLVGLLLILSINLVVQQAAAAPRAANFDAIDTWVQGQMQKGNIPGLAYAIVSGDQVVHSQAFGVADSKQRKMTPATPMYIGSLSKSITALAVMQLVEGGKLDLDQPLQKYVPNFTLAKPEAAAKISLRHVLNQTSGIPNSAGLQLIATGPVATSEDILAYLKTVSPTSPAGEAFQYSNMNYALAGMAVENASGEAYGDYVQKYIYTPLGMNNSYTTKSAAKENGLAQGNSWWFGFSMPHDSTFLPHSLPAGFLISSAEDMARFVGMQINQGKFAGQTLLSPAGIATLHQAALPDKNGAGYGMGWYVGRLDGLDLDWHRGMVDGYLSSMLIVPAEKLGVVILTNNSGLIAPPLDTIARGIALQALGKPAPNTGLPLWINYLGLDLVIIAILIYVIRRLTDVNNWRDRLSTNKPQDTRAWLKQAGIPILTEFAITVFVFLILPRLTGFPLWVICELYQPDLSYFVLVTGMLTLVMAIIRLVMVFRIAQEGLTD